MLKQTVIRLSVDLRRRVKIAAAERDISLQELITEALEAHLGKEHTR